MGPFCLEAREQKRRPVKEEGPSIHDASPVCTTEDDVGHRSSSSDVPCQVCPASFTTLSALKPRILLAHAPSQTDTVGDEEQPLLLSESKTD